jgi:hypothetical protein
MFSNTWVWAKCWRQLKSYEMFELRKWRHSRKRKNPSEFGAMTFSITTFRITTLCITILSIMTLSITIKRSAIMLSSPCWMSFVLRVTIKHIKLSVIMLNIVKLSVIMLTAVVPQNSFSKTMPRELKWKVLFVRIISSRIIVQLWTKVLRSLCAKILKWKIRRTMA